MDIQLTVKAEECPYWNYDTGTARHTCSSCTCTDEGNNWSNVEYGIRIGKHRYCLINCDVTGKILEGLRGL